MSRIPAEVLLDQVSAVRKATEEYSSFVESGRFDDVLSVALRKWNLTTFRNSFKPVPEAFVQGCLTLFPAGTDRDKNAKKARELASVIWQTAQWGKSGGKKVSLPKWLKDKKALRRRLSDLREMSQFIEMLIATPGPDDDGPAIFTKNLSHQIMFNLPLTADVPPLIDFHLLPATLRAFLDVLKRGCEIINTAERTDDYKYAQFALLEFKFKKLTGSFNKRLLRELLNECGWSVTQETIEKTFQRKTKRLTRFPRPISPRSRPGRY